MFSRIGPLVALISIALTEYLVGSGQVAHTYSVAAASTATPVELTTATPHNVPLGRVVHGVVSGVGGMPETSGTWVLTPTGASTFAMSSFTPAGTSTPLEGLGTYSGGGQIQVAFPDYAILLGRRNLPMTTAVATPRIVFVPVGSAAWQIPEPYGGVIPAATRPRARASETDEQQLMKQSRQLATEMHRFEVHVTGAANPPSADFGDFDATQATYHALYYVLHERISPARALVLSGKWTSQAEGMGTLTMRGEKWVGLVEIHAPVLDDPLSFVPAGTVGSILVNFVGGSTGDETVIVVP